MAAPLDVGTLGPSSDPPLVDCVFVAMNGVPHKTAATEWTAVAFVIIFMFIFGYGWVAIPWLVSDFIPITGDACSLTDPVSAENSTPLRLRL